jgi:hypothetical protein
VLNTSQVGGGTKSTLDIFTLGVLHRLFACRLGAPLRLPPRRLANLARGGGFLLQKPTTNLVLGLSERFLSR